jgi:hypothetical protein
MASLHAVQSGITITLFFGSPYIFPYAIMWRTVVRRCRLLAGHILSPLELEYSQAKFWAKSFMQSINQFYSI